jgi:CarD family transcriptional regulator
MASLFARIPQRRRTRVPFKVGDKVVYPHHGAAVIEGTDTITMPDGTKSKYFVLRMTHGDLLLKVPTDRAEDIGMRYPISKEDVEDVFEVLAKKDVREPTNWSRRFKNHQEKLKSGDVYQVAEVVRNLALRDADKGLSAGEKSMFVKARQVLVSELAFALNISEDTALERLNKTLS